ncbi:MAG: hypothetical protein MJK12_03020 [Colwellia sp.]|nr:hypothetical protein [Colwellia sp.]
MSNKFIIAFEGMDGSGKTTFSSLVSKELDKLGVSNRLWPIDSLGRITEEERANPELSFKYYINAIKTKLNTRYSGALLFDRYVPSATGYKYLRNDVSFEKGICFNLNNDYSEVIKPDLVIVLSAPTEVRRNRIIKKKIVDSYDLLSIEKQSVDFWQKFYTDIADNTFIFVDTNRSANLVLDEIMQQLSNRFTDDISNKVIQPASPNSFFIEECRKK